MGWFSELFNAEESKHPHNGGISTVKLAVILFGSAAVIYTTSLLWSSMHQTFDDLHDSDKED